MGRCNDDFDFGAAWWSWAGPWASRSGPRKGGRGPRGRVFDRGDLKYAVLRLLARKPMHGYEVMQALEEESGGWYTASPGSVYPVLQLLQDQGYVTSAEEDGKRIYRITEEGRAFLEKNSDRVEDVMDRVSDFGSRFAATGMADVAKSFMKLAQTSAEEAMRSSTDPETLKRIREILEEAAKEMQGRRATSRSSSASD